MSATTEMPRYQSHKKVWALQIESVEDLGTDTTTPGANVRLNFVDKGFAPRDVNLFGRPTPSSGWYMVEYDNNYTSFSPSKEFEEGYTRIG